MADIINPHTGQPTKRKLTDEEIITAFQALQLKLDSLATQVFNAALLIEFMVDRMNSLSLEKDAISDEETSVAPLAIDTEEFTQFVNQRVEEMRNEMLKGLPGQEQQIDLNE